MSQRIGACSNVAIKGYLHLHLNEAPACFQPGISYFNFCFPLFPLIIRVRNICLVLADVVDKGMSSFWDHTHD